MGKNMIDVNTGTFSKKNIKSRIMNLMTLKKVKIMAIAAGVVIIAGIGLMIYFIYFIKNPIGDNTSTKILKAHSVIHLSPFFSVTNNTFLENKKDNKYLISDYKFEIVSQTGKDNILIINPQYIEESVGELIYVMGEMGVDVSGYRNRQSFRVLSSDGNDTGYIIYKMDNETWISYWNWYGTKKNSLMCDYIIRLK